MKPEQRCFLVCNAHLDPVWLWPWEEGLTEAISTYRVAADFLDTYPDFVFNHNESLLYEWVERNDAPLFKRIQAHVASGRWHAAGGAYLQPDLIATSGESVIRQYLVGKRYFAEKFGVESRVSHNFDTFGHPQGMIQILAGCGFDAYVFCRPNPGQMRLPIGSFVWRHASGVEIVARRSDDHYITQGQLRKQMMGSAKQAAAGAPDSDAGSWPAHYRAAEGDFMFLWGLGNHGGGATHEEYAQLPGVRADFPKVEFIESTTDAFFAHTLKTRGRENLPVVAGGDLSGIFKGCYTSMLRVKQEHRRMENMMQLTERLCAMAWWTGRRDYPAKDLEVAWKDILFAEFHDILPGSGIPQVEADSLKLLGHCEEILRRKKAEALIALLRDEPLAEREDTPFFVFNPFNWEVSREVVVEYGTAKQAGTDAIVRTVLCDGEPVEAQFEKGDLNLDNAHWGEWRQKAVFKVTLPPMSYKRFDTTYSVLPAEQVQRWQSPSMPESGALTIVGEAMSVAINLATGLVDSVRVGGVEQVQPGSFRPAVFDDLSHSWDCPATWTESACSFRLATPAEATERLGQARVEGSEHVPQRPVQIIEDGPFRTVVEAYFVAGHSWLTQRYIVNKRSAVLQVELDVFWAVASCMFKLGFTPAALPQTAQQDAPQLWAEKCYSIDNESVPQGAPDGESTFQHFLRWTDGARHIGVISHGTHGFHQARATGTTWLSVLRSPGYGFHQDAVGDWPRYANRRSPRQDQGERSATFTVVFGADAADNASLARKAYEYNVGLETLVYFPTTLGAAKKRPSPFLATDRANVVLGALKKAEDGDALILRFWETAGESTDFTLSVDGASFPCHIGAHRLQTYRLDRASRTLTATDLLERPAKVPAPALAQP